MSKANEKKPDGRKISRKLKPRQRKNKPKNPPAGDPGRRLTPKEERLVKCYADPKSSTFGNGTKSAIKAGYSKRSANTIASQTLAKRNVRLALLREIHAHGGTLALTGKRLAEGLSAHQTRVFLSKDGRLVYSDELVDFDQRRKYAELVARFEGALPTPQEQERIALLQIQQTFNLVPPVDPVPEVIEIEGTVEE
ncbi:MAG: terminase small subunit [Acidobacteria bacterium]|nr:terminase small subunit [Acidobacteriota bacterium]